MALKWLHHHKKFYIFGMAVTLSLLVYSLTMFYALKGKNYKPRHIHLSRKFLVDSMTVTWSTKNLPEGRFIEYGTDKLKDIVRASTDTLESEDGTTNQFIHEATMTQLVSGGHYYYRCVSLTGKLNETRLQSATYKFKVPLDGTDWSPNLLVFGDLGVENPVILPYLKKEVDLGSYDAVLHIGDIAYQLYDKGGQVGNDFMKLIESMAAKIPYQVCPGNHEIDYNRDYNEYSKRFRMPGDFFSLFYSWDLGPVHFVSISTEFYFYNPQFIQTQYRWLKEDLQKANKVRHLVPWIIVYGHTPMYCSNENDDSCTKVDSPLRMGCPQNTCLGLENLFYEEKVDMQIYGHEHSYEATYPLYNYTVYKSSNAEEEDNNDGVYYIRNPEAPIHVITGAGGSKWELSGFRKSVPNWSRIRNSGYSYSRLKILNHTHLYWEQVGVAGNGGEKESWIIDKFYVVKDIYASSSSSSSFSPVSL